MCEGHERRVRVDASMKTEKQGDHYVSVARGVKRLAIAEGRTRAESRKACGQMLAQQRGGCKHCGGRMSNRTLSCVECGYDVS